MSKKNNFTKYIEWIILIICFAGVVFVAGKFNFSQDLKPETTNEKIIMYVGIFLMFFVVLGVHELGHLITGLASGFQFQMFVVGPLGVRREDEKVKVYLNKNLAYFGGIAATSPVDDSNENARKFANILLAGPIYSIVFTFLCFALAYLILRPLGIVFYAGAFMSFGIFIATTIPSKTGMFFTDRKRYQRLVTPGKDQDVELAMLRIMGKTSMDKSYRNVKKEDIELLVAEELPFLKFFGLFNKKCYQIEMAENVDEDTLAAYEKVSTEMPKNVVLAFDKEFDKFRSELEAQKNQ